MVKAPFGEEARRFQRVVTTAITKRNLLTLAKDSMAGIMSDIVIQFGEKDGRAQTSGVDGDRQRRTSSCNIVSMVAGLGRRRQGGNLFRLYECCSYEESRLSGRTWRVVVITLRCPLLLSALRVRCLSSRQNTHTCST